MDVGGWLRGLGLGQYEEKFRDNKIDADVLPRLTVDDLKDIGVSAVGDRRRLLDAIAALAGAGRPADVPASPTKSAPSKGLQASAERRPITVMFCDLVGSTSLAAKLDAEDWRNLVNAYLDEASAAVTGLRRPCAEEARRRADGALRLSAGAGERRRARGAGGARHPARARRPQRQERRQGRAGAVGAHRHRVRAGRRGGDRRGVRRRAECRRAGAGGGRAWLGPHHPERPAPGRRALRRRGARRARTQGRVSSLSSSSASFAPAAAAEGVARGR